MKENSFVSRNGSAGPSFLGPHGPHGIPLSVILIGRKKNLIAIIKAKMPPPHSLSQLSTPPLRGAEEGRGEQEVSGGQQALPLLSVFT